MILSVVIIQKLVERAVLVSLEERSDDSAIGDSVSAGKIRMVVSSAASRAGMGSAS